MTVWLDILVNHQCLKKIPSLSRKKHLYTNSSIHYIYNIFVFGGPWNRVAGCGWAGQPCQEPSLKMKSGIFGHIFWGPKIRSMDLFCWKNYRQEGFCHHLSVVSIAYISDIYICICGLKKGYVWYCTYINIPTPPIALLPKPLKKSTKSCGIERLLVLPNWELNTYFSI